MRLIETYQVNDYFKIVTVFYAVFRIYSIDLLQIYDRQKMVDLVL